MSPRRAAPRLAAAASFVAIVAFVQAATPSAEAIRQAGEVFLGPPALSTQRVFAGRGARDIITTKTGTVLVFQDKFVRESTDGGATWSEPREVGPDAGGKVVVNETNGEILYVNAPHGFLWKSRDNGRTWTREPIKITPDKFGFGTPEGTPVGIGAFQPGVTLQYGPHRGRLIIPCRVFGPKNSNDVEWRPYHYNTAIYSDDNGSSWKLSAPFPVLGSGEAALAELSDGSILYSSREHMSRNNRYFARSYDGGELWLNPYQDPVLPDGARGTSYGCMGGLLRLPIDGADVVLYSNLDTDAGTMPKRVGASTSAGREKVTVWVSFDGGHTWPLKRLVYDGPSAYSNLGVGRKGTPSEGKIYLNFEGGKKDCYEAVFVAVFNLSWLLNGHDLREFLRP